MCEPIVNSLGLELWDVRYLKEGAQWYLRVFIDKQEGVTIEDCENVSRAIDEPLDQLDPVDQSYCLEVCSPGLERELVRPEHFQRFEGWPVLVKLSGRWIPASGNWAACWEPMKTACLTCGSMRQT